MTVVRCDGVLAVLTYLLAYLLPHRSDDHVMSSRMSFSTRPRVTRIITLSVDGRVALRLGLDRGWRSTPECVRYVNVPSRVVTLRSHPGAPLAAEHSAAEPSAMASWGPPTPRGGVGRADSSFERGTSVSFGRVISKEPTKISPPIQDEEDLRFTFEAPGGGVDQEKPYWCAHGRTTARLLLRRKSSEPATPLPPTGCRETTSSRRRRHWPCAPL